MVFTKKRRALILMEFIDFNLCQAKYNSDFRVGFLCIINGYNPDSEMNFYLIKNIDISFDMDFRALQYLEAVAGTQKNHHEKSRNSI